MEKALVDYIMAQRAEAEEFSKQPGCWMGSMPHPEDTQYWTQRVPSGTLKEFQRIELEEDAYYTIAEAYSKSYARAHDFSQMSDEELQAEIDSASQVITREIEREKEEKAEEEAILNKIASDIGVDRSTLDRWMKAA